MRLRRRYAASVSSVLRASIRALFLVAPLGGCAPGVFEGGIHEAATGPRVAAIARVEATNDRAAIPQVVECLASNDPVVREAAIRCLHSLTGTTLDYRAGDPPLQRAQAVDRWVKWCRDEGLAAPDGGAITT